jgi:peroxiredoxin Q/BCP
VVGISVDDVESHKEFSDKYKLPFTILADEDSETAKAYGVLRDYKLIKLASRQSFLIDPEGKIAKHYEKVDPDTHTDEVLADIKQFMDNGESKS